VKISVAAGESGFPASYHDGRSVAYINPSEAGVIHIAPELTDEAADFALREELAHRAHVEAFGADRYAELYQLEMLRVGDSFAHPLELIARGEAELLPGLIKPATEEQEER
jgi:hypothetical protein